MRMKKLEERLIKHISNQIDLLNELSSEEKRIAGSAGRDVSRLDATKRERKELSRRRNLLKQQEKKGILGKIYKRSPKIKSWYDKQSARLRSADAKKILDKKKALDRYQLQKALAARKGR